MKLSLMCLGLIATFATAPMQKTTENYSKTAEELKKGSIPLLYFVGEKEEMEVAARAVYRVIIVDNPQTTEPSERLKLRELPPVNIKWGTHEQENKKNSKEEK